MNLQKKLFLDKCYLNVKNKYNVTLKLYNETTNESPSSRSTSTGLANVNDKEAALISGIKQ